MIYDDYIEYSRVYREKYGERTVVLMEVGSFFELYAVQNKDETSGADIATICDLCNLQLSRKNKAIVGNSRTNPLMAGFPSFSVSKHTQMLLQHNYTIVLVRQVTSPPNPIREVTEVLSPGLQLCPQGVEGSWLFVSYWESHNSQLSVGFAGVDVSTGQTWVYEVSGSALSLDEMARCMSVYQPKEVVVTGAPHLSDSEKMAILDAVNGDYHVIWDAQSLSRYMQVSYQNAVIEKSYSSFDFGMLQPLEALDLEKFGNVRTAFTYMIQFGYEHNQSIIKHLKKPKHLSFDKRCNLEHTSAVQLQLIKSGSGGGSGSNGGSGGSGGRGERPLLSILNRCATAFGGREFKSRLLQPIYDTEELQRRYDEIDACLNSDLHGVYSSLRGVLDLERMGRRILLGTFSPTDWPSLNTSLEHITEAANLAQRDDIAGKVTGIMALYEGILDLTECSKYLIGDIKGNVFMSGVYEEVDEAAARLKSTWSALENLAAFFNQHGEGCKVEFNEREGYTIQVTKRRWDNIKASLPPSFVCESVTFSLKDITSKSISASSTIVKLHHSWISEQSDLIQRTTHGLVQQVVQRYHEFLSKFAKESKDLLTDCITLVGDLDIVNTCARNAKEFKYTRPTLGTAAATGAAATGSWFKAGAMRHPILERLNDRVMYVPNDVSLGSSGLLLFGVNSSGKSSLMKAIGLNVIMAQAGMYVASGSFEYAPYKHIFTRIAGSDDIYRGWSTFTVEMMELRNILQRCDAASLVLGDELCSGTESLSATALVAAGIETLADAKASFVFATHLHDLSKMKRIAENERVSLCHMHVECVDGNLIFDRRLRTGVGTGVYGLEVCRGLNLPPDFMKRAHEVRCELEGRSPELVDSKQSRYNATVYMDKCKICGKPPKETHHIAQQREADTEGMIDHFHKNSSFNLMAVCESCHDDIHAGKLHVEGYMATSSGVKLKVKAKRTTKKTQVQSVG